ncbi:PP2C family protein-serine/threonine phosphatase [Streptomyces seoulensis]
MNRLRAGTQRGMRPGAVFLAVGTGIVLHARRTILHELRQARAVAGAAQNALLRPLPPHLAGFGLAAAQLSADRGAAVGGDLYEVIATEYGLRVVMGDVRGHGLAALGTVAAVLGSFREAAHDERELAGVLRRLERALARHQRTREPQHPAAEDFVTLLLLEIADDGRVRTLNCGHPWPHRLRGRGAEPVAAVEPLPPLGAFPLPRELPTADLDRLLPGDTLVLYTDGVLDARDARGRFFPLAQVLAGVARAGPMSARTVLRVVFTALLRHTGNRRCDDAAVLVVRDDRDLPHPARSRAGADTGPRRRPADESS